MKSAARSIYAFSAYLLVAGAVLVVKPGTLAIIGLSETDALGIRILGVTALVLALYYFDAARNDTRSFFAATLLGRGFSAAAMVLFWATGHPWQLLVFAGIEMSGAVWTYTAMRSEASR